MKRFGQAKCKKLEQDAMLAEAGEEDEFVKCFDDIILARSCPWQAVKEAREKELKYLRVLGVYEEVDEHAAVAKYNVTPVDTKWVDTDTAFEGEPTQIRSRFFAREFKSGDRPDLYAGLPHWKLRELSCPLLRVTVQSSHGCMSMFPVHTSTPRLTGPCW